MAFLKFINETITYPYNTKTDYPHTGFPPGADYPEFNIFWVYPTSPNPPENNSATEGTPVFNTELNRWEQTWSYTPVAPLPDWTNFNLAMILPETESSFEVWLGQFKPAYQTALTVPAALGQLSETQSAYNTLKTLAAPTAEQTAEWQGIADQFHIGITF
ncbi:MAG: hypothetical protein ACO33E_00140 [Aquiluna sp.]